MVQIANCCKQVDYDLKHGVTIEEVFSVLQKIKSDESFASILQNESSMHRLNEIEKYILTLKNLKTES